MEPTTKIRVQGMAALAACALLWSLAGVFIKLVPWNPLLITGLRSLIASFVLLFVLKKPHFHWSKPQIWAALLNVCTMTLFVYANKHTTAANAILLQYSAPVFTAIAGAILLKEKAKPEQLIAFVFVAAGMAIFFMGGVGGGSLLGNIASSVSGLTFGLYFVAMRMQKNGSPMESILLAHWITAAIMIPLSFFAEKPVVTLPAVGAILVLGLLQVGLASVFFAYGIKRVNAVQGVLVTVVEPVFSPVWVFLALGEKPALNSIIGGLVIVAAVTGASIITARRKQEA